MAITWRGPAVSWTTLTVGGVCGPCQSWVETLGLGAASPGPALNRLIRRPGLFGERDEASGSIRPHVQVLHGHERLDAFCWRR